MTFFMNSGALARFGHLPARVFAMLALCLALSACGGAQRGSDMLSAGQIVPDLSSTDQNGAPVRLRDPVPTLVYFYPKDGTPGCTREACAFRDAWNAYRDAKLRVIGVSSDSLERHKEFAAEHGLPFSLVSDPEHVWSKAFGVGTFAGLDARVSFLIDATGHVATVYENVDPGLHAREVIEDAKLRSLVN